MYKPLIVIHDTGESNSTSVISYLQNPTTSVSYHTLINLNGDIIYLNPANTKVNAAGTSSFNGESINESVDEFAYHIALEHIPLQTSVSDGYTDAQYLSLACLCAKTSVNIDRIVLHKDIRKQSQDPKNFNKAKFEKLLKSFPQTKEIFFDIGDE